MSLNNTRAYPSSTTKPLATSAAPSTDSQITTSLEEQNGYEWLLSFGCSMVPITAFGWIHSRGWTGRAVEAVVRSPMGVYGLLALPFVTLAMEKSIYDTTQAMQGIDPNVIPEDRGGFPSGGANLPSLSLLPVKKIISFAPPVQRRPTATNAN